MCGFCIMMLKKGHPENVEETKQIEVEWDASLYRYIYKCDGEKNCFCLLVCKNTYVHSYSFHKSTHSNGSGQMTLAHGLFEGQLRSRLRAIVA